jgi:hypothetical protein
MIGAVTKMDRQEVSPPFPQTWMLSAVPAGHQMDWWREYGIVDPALLCNALYAKTSSKEAEQIARILQLGSILEYPF